MTLFSAFCPPRHCLRGFIALAVAALASGPAAAQAGNKDTKAGPQSAPAEISAETMSGRPDREINLEGNVEIKRGTTTINADRATYDVVEDEVEASGNVRMRRLDDRYAGDELKFKLDAGQGFVARPTYRLGRSNGQGGARRIDFQDEDRAIIVDGTYSTCEGPDPDWYLKCDTLQLDRDRDVGTASNTIVYFKGVPILGTPALSFPLSDARKTGFLAPSVGTNSTGGLELTAPYYFNIAPNRDLTLYPSLITRRGLQLGADGRYLEAAYRGQTKLEWLPNDQKTNTTRYAITSTHAQMLAPALSFGWNLSAASDDDYPNDFARGITVANSTRLLLRDVNLNYVRDFWSAGMRTSNYQVLQDPAAPIARPYDRLPQFTFLAGRQDVRGFDWSIDTELTRFSNRDLVGGERLVLTPRVAYPIIRPGYFLTPKLSFDLSKYRLTKQAAGAPTNLTRSVPTFSLDSGMVFERDAWFFGRNMNQTLEPRLFYVRTPYRDQSLFPNFDSADADLSFVQLFSENRFVGRDRIGDANQLTVALASRFIEESGVQRMRFAVGQRYYFSDQRVSLGAVSSQSRSDLLLSASGTLSATLGVDGNIQLSESSHDVFRASYAARWQPAPKRVLNLQYRRDFLNDLEQLDVSGQWPIADRWYSIGRVNYSLPNRQIVEGLLGMEYKADCWIFRVVVQRTPTATDKATTSTFFQLQLNGLAKVGSNPLDAIRASIPGYQLIDQSEYPKFNNSTPVKP